MRRMEQNTFILGLHYSYIFLSFNCKKNCVHIHINTYINAYMCKNIYIYIYYVHVYLLYVCMICHFSYIKCVIQWHQLYSQCSVTTITIYLQKFSLSKTETFFLIPDNLWPSFYSLRVCLFEMFLLFYILM